MSETSDQDDSGVGIGDDQLPDDLVADEDNPLAAGLDEDEAVDDLLQDGRPGERTEADGPGGLGSTDDDSSDDPDDEDD